MSCQFNNRSKRSFILSKISSTSDLQSVYSAQDDEDFSPQSRVLSSGSLGANSGALRSLSSHRSNVSSAHTSYASAVSSFGSEHGSDVASSYARSRASSARSSDSAWTFYSRSHSEAGSAAEDVTDNMLERLSQASARYSNASVPSSGNSTRSSSRIEVDPNSGKAIYADHRSSSNRVSDVLSEAGEPPPYGRSPSIASVRSRAASDVSSRAASEAPSLTPSRRMPSFSSGPWSETGSFHLSDRSSVAEALATTRMGYSTDSSRRLTSYEGSTTASSVPPSQYSIAPSYRGSLTPSSEFAVRAAIVGGRFTGTDRQLDRLSSASESTVSSLHLSEANDVLGPLRPSQFRTQTVAGSNAPSEIQSAVSSSRLSTALSSSRRLGATGVAPRVTRGDIESLSNASVLEGHLRPAGRRNPQISPDEFWAFLDKQ